MDCITQCVIFILLHRAARLKILILHRSVRLKILMSIKKYNKNLIFSRVNWSYFYIWIQLFIHSIIEYKPSVNTRKKVYSYLTSGSSKLSIYNPHPPPHTPCFGAKNAGKIREGVGSQTVIIWGINHHPINPMFEILKHHSYKPIKFFQISEDFLKLMNIFKFFKMGGEFSEIKHTLHTSTK